MKVARRYVGARRSLGSDSGAAAATTSNSAPANTRASSAPSCGADQRRGDDAQQRRASVNSSARRPTPPRLLGPIARGRSTSRRRRSTAPRDGQHPAPPRPAPEPSLAACGDARQLRARAPVVVGPGQRRGWQHRDPAGRVRVVEGVGGGGERTERTFVRRRRVRAPPAGRVPARSDGAEARAPPTACLPRAMRARGTAKRGRHRGATRPSNNGPASRSLRSGSLPDTVGEPVVGA